MDCLDWENWQFGGPPRRKDGKLRFTKRRNKLGKKGGGKNKMRNLRGGKMLVVGDNPGYQGHVSIQIPGDSWSLWPVVLHTGSYKQWQSEKQHGFLLDL